jgi:hypothetical protein
LTNLFVLKSNRRIYGKRGANGSKTIWSHGKIKRFEAENKLKTAAFFSEELKQPLLKLSKRKATTCLFLDMSVIVNAAT